MAGAVVCHRAADKCRQDGMAGDWGWKQWIFQELHFDSYRPRVQFCFLMNSKVSLRKNISAMFHKVCSLDFRKEWLQSLQIEKVMAFFDTTNDSIKYPLPPKNTHTTMHTLHRSSPTFSCLQKVIQTNCSWCYIWLLYILQNTQSPITHSPTHLPVSN